jgi:hypothetical protein
MLLVIVQLAQSQDPLERVYQVSKLLEDQQNSVFAAQIDHEAAGNAVTGELSLCLENYFSIAGIKVIINGVEKGNFLTKELTLQVSSGDQIAIDGSSCSQAVRVEVSNTSPRIISPKLGSIIQLQGDVKYLNPVQVKLAY